MKTFVIVSNIEEFNNVVTTINDELRLGNSSIGFVRENEMDDVWKVKSGGKVF